MRKFLMAVAIGGLVLLLAAPAMALDFKFGAEYRVRFYDYANTGFDSSSTLNNESGGNAGSGTHGNNRGVQLRIRPRFDASDDNGNIQATIRFETGDTNWGTGGGAGADSFGTNFGNVQINGTTNRTGNGAGGAMGADGVSLEVKWGFLDFAIPNVPLRVRAGIQPWYLPKGLVIDDDVSGVRAYGNSGNANYEAFWWRVASTPLSSTAAAGTIGQPRFDASKSDTFDIYGGKIGYNFGDWLNASAWYFFGANDVNCTNDGVVTGYQYITGPCSTGIPVNRNQQWLGVDLIGKVGTVDYDLDFAYGNTSGGQLGSFTLGSVNVANAASNTLQPIRVAGFAIDGGVHIPIGPVKLNLLATYATGDKGNNNGSSSSAYPYGISPSWSGAGGQYELIGEGGAFDVISMTQHSPVGLYMLGATVEYVPVKALWLKAAYGFVGFSDKYANCGWAFNNAATLAGTVTQTAGTTCFGPVYIGKPTDPMYNKSWLGNELHFRADYTMWTGFKIQAMAGWLFPSAGDIAGKYILQFLYNF
jgi:hypothetical protein